MALVDDQVFIPGQGRLLVAPVGTPRPTNLITIPAPWDDLGHSSIEDGITIGREGGDSETLGTWQNPVLRERRDPTSWFMTMFLHQVSNEVLNFFFGGGDAVEPGVFGVPIVPVAQERALLAQIIDGTNRVSIYIPKASLLADDDVEVDVEQFLAFPVRATLLGVTGQDLMEWLDDALGGLDNEVQSIAITGSPTGGTYTLTFDGQTTSAIAYNATASTVQAALRALSNIGDGDVTCTGGPHPGTAVVATFGGNLAGINVAQMTATGSFTGGTSPAITVTTTTQGG